MTKRIIAVIAALLLAAAALPAFALEDAGLRHNTPAGYNHHDYQKMADFLDTEISVTFFGQTMTRRIYEWFQMVDSNFSMADPSTWHVSYDGAQQFYTEWTSVGGELRLMTVWADPTVTTFTGYTGGGLDLAGCTEMVTLVANTFRLVSLDVSGCTKLACLECKNNNTLASIDLTGCALLASLDLTGCLLTSIDLDDCPLLPFDTISANGYGTVYFAGSSAYAVPNSGRQFLGWYSESGAFISSAAQLSAGSTAYTRVSARFTGAVVPVLNGDADGDGNIALSDALCVLRAAMGLVPVTDSLLSSCDLDQDGSLTVSDAIRILRFAMGLTTQV